jgi:glycosyltransferase involved in cell wall biosynthesis
VGGGESAPKTFWKDFSLRGKFYETMRSSVRWIGEHDPFVKLTASSSAKIWATTEDTAKRLNMMGVTKLSILSESGLSHDEIKYLSQQSSVTDSSAMRFISMARLLHWKGLHLGIRAFAEANIENAEYWILGEGPERKRLQNLAEELGIASKVKLLGKLPRQEALQTLATSLALVHPSLHDSGGWVCLEAMAVGCPVICLDLGGPATQVSLETGFKVLSSSPEQAVTEISNAMKTLADEPELRHKMSSAGKLRVKQHFNWDVKARYFSDCYEKLANS